MAENILLPSYTGITALSDLGVYALTIPTTEEMFWAWQDGVNDIFFVEFDGNTYECTPQVLAAMDNAMAVGNCTNFGGTGNGEPFIITILPVTDENGDATGAYYWAVAALTDTAPTEHTVEVYQVEASTAFAVVLKDRSGADVTYEVPSEQIKLNTPNGIQIFTAGQAVENVPITLDLADGDQTINAPDGYLVKSAVIQKPATLVPENIAEGVKIAGVEGSFAGSGGESDEVKSKAINFFDPFGNIIYSYTRAEAAALTELPEGPALDGFTFAGWTSTLAQIKAETLFMDIAPYYTKDGKNVSVLIVDVSQYDLSLTVCLAISSTSTKATIDWGDGSTTTGITGSSSTSGMTKTSTHTYTTPGIKYICIYLTAGSSYGLGSGYTSPYRTVVYSESYSTAVTQPYPDYALISVLGHPTETNGVKVVGNQRLKFCSCPYLYFTNALSMWCCPAVEHVVTQTIGCQATTYCFWGCTTLKRLRVNYLSSTLYTLMCCDNLSDVIIVDGQIPQNINHNRCLVITKTSGVLSTYAAITQYQYGDGLIYVPDDLIETYKSHTLFAPVVDCIRPLSEYPDF